VLGEHRGGYSGESERVEQRRAVLSWFGQFWLIVDEFAAYGPRELETLWHFPPTTQVRLSSDRIFTDDPGRPNLLLLPAQPERGHLDLVRGQSKPEIQGWFSPRYNEKQSAIVARFRQSIHHPVVQAWLLIPSKTQSLGGEIQALPSQAGTSRVKVRVPGQPDRIIRIDFTAKTVEQALQVEEAPTALTWNDGPKPGGDDGKN
jgi:hypothetical protein